MGRITFVTGTDTGVGKTLLTACLVTRLRQRGIHALALKPFCTGSRSDARVLRQAIEDELTLDEVNPFYFEMPLAPSVAATRAVPLKACQRSIEKISRRCEHLLVEGAGGVLTPLGKTFFITGLVSDDGVVLVARNRLGTINHTLLAANALPPSAIVLMGQRRPDLSSESNATVIRELLPKTPVSELPYLGSAPKGRKRIEEAVGECSDVLDRLIEAGNKKPHRNAVW